jgi:predicted transposase YdaD
LKQTRFYQQARSEGLVEGIEKGMGKGRVEGKAALVVAAVGTGFRALPAAARQRISNADADTLLVLGERRLDAKNLDEVFADSASCNPVAYVLCVGADFKR